jgi:hypothetical protein
LSGLRVARRQTIESRRGIEPNSRELQIRFAHFVSICLAGPLNTFLGHGAVLRGRFHANAPIPEVILLATCVERVTAVVEKKGQDGAMLYERLSHTRPLRCQVCVTAKPFSIATMLTEKRGRSPMSGRGFGLGLGFPGLGFAGLGFLAFAFASAAAAQGNLDQGKSGAQLYASACATCHKSPPSLSNSRWFFGLESFLREHYTSSPESAALLATYLKGQEKALADSQRGRLARQTAQTRRDQSGTSAFGEDIPRPPADIPDVKR